MAVWHPTPEHECPRARTPYRPTTAPTHAASTRRFVPAPVVDELPPAARSRRLWAGRAARWISRGRETRPREAGKRPRTRTAPDAPRDGWVTSPERHRPYGWVPPHLSSGRRRWLAVATPQSSTTATRAPQVLPPAPRRTHTMDVRWWGAMARGGRGARGCTPWQRSSHGKASVDPNFHHFFGGKQVHG